MSDVLTDLTLIRTAALDLLLAVDRIEAALHPQEPAGRPVTTSDELHAALLEGGTLLLQAGTRFEGRFVVSQSGTTVQANGATFHSPSGPAWDVPAQEPAITDIRLLDMASVTAVADTPILLGRNTPEQTRLEQVPRNITLERVFVPSHNGPLAKNGLENNAINVTLLDCGIADVFNTRPAGILESHCLVTLNTPGGLTVRGGTYSGASINFLSGGDPVDIPGVVIADLTYEGLTITKPPGWMTDGQFRLIKNLVEFKHGERVVIRDCELSYSWGPEQRGWAFVFTPKTRGSVRDVLVDRCRVHHVGGGVNITGRQLKIENPVRTTGIRILHSTFDIQHDSTRSEYGWFMLLADGPGTIDVEDCEIRCSGTSLVRVDDTDRIERLAFRRCTIPKLPKYSVATPLGNNAIRWQEVFDELTFQDCVIGGAPASFKALFPGNTYVDAA